LNSRRSKRLSSEFEFEFVYTFFTENPRSLPMTLSLSPLEDLIPIEELEDPTETPEVAQIHFTPEDLFRTVARHLFRQGCQSTLENNSNECLYRGPKGRMCAVGFLIPDSSYSSAMEGRGIDSLIEDFGGGLPRAILDNSSLLNRLQHIHDSHSPSSSFTFREHLLYELTILAVEQKFQTRVIREYFSETKNS